MLAEAGWKDTDGDGILEKDGQPFEFTILTNQDDDLRRNAATIIQCQLKKIGIDVDVRVLEWAALLHNCLYKRNFEACIIGFAVDYDPNQFDKWNSQKIGPYEHNWMHYQNEEVDILLELAVSTFDPKERKKYYDRFQKILSEDRPCTFLWVPNILPIVHSRFCGIRPAPMGIDYNLERWYVPKLLQKHCIPNDSTMAKYVDPPGLTRVPDRRQERDCTFLGSATACFNGDVRARVRVSSGHCTPPKF